MARNPTYSIVVPAFAKIDVTGPSGRGAARTSSTPAM